MNKVKLHLVKRNVGFQAYHWSYRGYCGYVGFTKLDTGWYAKIVPVIVNAQGVFVSSATTSMGGKNLKSLKERVIKNVEETIL